MILISWYSFIIFAAVFYCGIGFAALLSPRSLRGSVIWWLSPFYGTALISVVGVWLSLLNVPMVFAVYFILALSSLLFFIALHKKKINIKINTEFILLFVSVLLTFGINIYPLIRNAGFPSVISLGNLDPISYTHVADFFLRHTVHEGAKYIPYSPYIWAVGDLIHNGFRWGTPMLLAFFSAITLTRSFEIYTIVITLYFAISVPLVYCLAKQFVGKRSFLLLFLIFFTYAINSTLAYMLYNTFFAQFIFAGMYIAVLVLLHDYYSHISSYMYKLTLHDFSIGFILSAIMTLYPEGSLFVFAPLFLMSFIRLFHRRRRIYMAALFRIVLVTVFFNPVVFFTTIPQYISVFLRSTNTAFIGWEKLPYSTPLEWLGLYNMYYSRELPLSIHGIISIILFVVFLIGLFKVKHKLVLVSFFSIFFCLYVFYRFISPNYFAYHRAVTYSIFLYSILFSIGTMSLLLFFKRNLITVFIVIFFFSFSLRSLYRGWYQFYHHVRVVDTALVSLRELNNNKYITEPFFTSDVLLGEYDLWRRLWREYMLRDKKIVTRQNYPTDKKKTAKIRLVLAEKNVLEYNGRKLQYIKILWSNDYYQLGTVKDMQLP